MQYGGNYHQPETEFLEAVTREGKTATKDTLTDRKTPQFGSFLTDQDTMATTCTGRELVHNIVQFVKFILVFTSFFFLCV